MNKVAFITLGCKLNFSESSTFARQFAAAGFEEAAPGPDTDIFVVNTCSVTEHADKKCRNLIRKLHKTAPDASIVVTGCYAQLKPEEILKIDNDIATIRRHIDGGVETVEVPLPCVITVNGSAAPCRPCNAKLVMKYKYASCPLERQENEPRAELYATRPYLTLNQWSVADVDGDPNQCGLSGSPTKVKTVQNIVFQAKESKTITAKDADVEGLIKELLEEKIIG